MYLINAMKSGAVVTFTACIILILSYVFYEAFGWEFEKTILLLSAGVCFSLALGITANE